MKYFLDTEFHEYAKQPRFLGIPAGKKIDTIELISIGIVAEDDREYYAICKDFDLKAAWKNQWLKENVLFKIYTSKISGDMRNHISFSYKNMKRLINSIGKSKEEISKEILHFCSIHTGYSDFKNKSISNVVHWRNRTKEVDELLKEKNITTVFEGDLEFYAYYADYDWVVFAWLWGRMIDLPDGFPMYCIDLKQEMDRKMNNCSRNDFFTAFDFKNEGLAELTLEEKLEHLKMHVNYPDQENEHHALADAKWNKKLYEFICSI